MTCDQCGLPIGEGLGSGCEFCEEYIFGIPRREAELADEAERGYDPDKLVPRRIDDSRD